MSKAQRGHTQRANGAFWKYLLLDIFLVPIDPSLMNVCTYPRRFCCCCSSNRPIADERLHLPSSFFCCFCSNRPIADERLHLPSSLTRQIQLARRSALSCMSHGTLVFESIAPCYISRRSFCWGGWGWYLCPRESLRARRRRMPYDGSAPFFICHKQTRVSKNKKWDPLFETTLTTPD